MSIELLGDELVKVPSRLDGDVEQHTRQGYEKSLSLGVQFSAESAKKV